MHASFMKDVLVKLGPGAFLTHETAIEGPGLLLTSTTDPAQHSHCGSVLKDARDLTGPLPKVHKADGAGAEGSALEQKPLWD